MRVALVVMPFASADRPSLAAGLLKACLAERGIACDVKHFNLTFWKMLGHEAYRWFAEEASMIALAGEWVFSQALFGQRLSSWEAYEKDVLDYPVWGIPPEERSRIRDTSAMASDLIEIAFASTDWSRYDVVGFTSTFQQSLASLGLAKRIREAHPRIVLVGGGANFEGPMGRSYLEAFDALDYVATGESEESFPELCRRISDGRFDPPPGFLGRDGESIVAGEGRPGLFRLDGAPIPDFDEFFAVLRANDSLRSVAPWITVEASRGCWWGAVSHCTFCGLNGDTMAFRTKDWRRVVEETDRLQSRYGPAPLHFADNILAMSAFRDLLPFWAARRDTVPKFIEIKANLKRQQVLLLRDAGVTSVQPGIESFSNHTLTLMKKGVTGAQNVALLRWCTEAGVMPVWNLLFGFPGEAEDEESRALELARKIVHLRRPEGCAPIRMDRFSPNFERYAELGFTSVAPVPAYGHIFPFSESQAAHAAYFFTYEHPGRAKAILQGNALMLFTRAWREKALEEATGRLAVLPHIDGGHVLVDDRFTRARRAEVLSFEAGALLLACDAPTPRERAIATVARHLPESPLSAIEESLAHLIDQEVVAEIGDDLITLALLPEGFTVRGLARAS